MKTCIILLVMFCTYSIALAQDKPIHQDESGRTYLNLDEVDHFIYKGHRLTIGQLIDVIVEEQRASFVSELRKVLGFD